MITGDPDCKIVPAGRHLYARQLADAALRYGKTHQIDPLHIALNYGHHSKHWGVVTEAVKQIAQDTASDQQILVESLLGAMDKDAMPEDDLAALKRLMDEGDA